MEMNKIETYVNTEYGTSKPLFAIKNQGATKDIMKFGLIKAKAIVSAYPDLLKYVKYMESQTKKEETPKAKTKIDEPKVAVSELLNF